MDFNAVEFDAAAFDAATLCHTLASFDEFLNDVSVPAAGCHGGLTEVGSPLAADASSSAVDQPILDLQPASQCAEPQVALPVVECVPNPPVQVADLPKPFVAKIRNPENAPQVHDPPAVKLEKRKKRNRESAKISRERKTLQQKQMTMELEFYRQEYENLRHQVQFLQKENVDLKGKVDFLQELCTLQPPQLKTVDRQQLLANTGSPIA